MTSSSGSISAAQPDGARRRERLPVILTPDRLTGVPFDAPAERNRCPGPARRTRVSQRLSLYRAGRAFELRTLHAGATVRRLRAVAFGSAGGVAARER